MCTVSWCRPDPGSYVLFFNRDESKTRLPARPPQRFDCGDTAFLSPTDGDHGGTWLLANNHGLSIGLLNHYAASVEFSPKHPISRGALVKSLANAEDCSDFDEAVRAITAEDYRPFLLFAVSPLADSLWIWDGKSLTKSEARLPLTTSSFRSKDVTDYRKGLFAKLTDQSPTKLATFHDAHDPDRPGYSVRMRRDRSQTVSLSRVDVSHESVTFSYRPEQAETLAFAETRRVSIPRHGL